MTSYVLANQVMTGQVQSLDSLRAHSLPSDAMIFATSTEIQPANQNLGSYNLVESANALTLTTTGSVPIVTRSPFADVYKEGSLYFNGTVGNYVSGTAAGLAGTQWNTTGLTVEAWVNYPTFTNAALGTFYPSYPYTVGCFSPTTGSFNWGFGSNSLGYVSFSYYNGAQVSINSTIQLATNTWNHIAFSCLPGGATANVYVNGVSVATAAISGTPSTNQTTLLTLGQGNGSTAITAYVADVRITTGAALYTGSSFTVPGAPLSTAATGVTQALIRAGQNSPTIQNGALTFDRGLKQYMNFGPQTFNVVTRGFTAVWRGAFTGTVGNYERIFEFLSSASTSVNSANSNAIMLARNATGTSLYFIIQPLNNSAGASPYAVVAGTLAQGVPAVVAVRYSPVTQLMDLWVNGVFQGSTAATTAQLSGDRILGFTATGYNSQSASTYTSITSNTLAVYNRALSDGEIYNSYLALTTSTTNAPIEIGDANGTPALSIAGDGRVSVQALGQTSNVLPWPPAAMTGYDTVINGGVYKARASSEYGSLNIAWYAFDKNTTTNWCSPSIYSTSSPYSYSGSVTTTDVNGTVYPGEWFQVQLPNPITLVNYTYLPNSDTQSPRNFVVLGSNDGINWTVVDSRRGISWTYGISQTFTLSTPATRSFSYYRISAQQLYGNGGVFLIVEWTLYGTADTAQPLTIAQPVTLSYGAQTASLTGIQNPGVYAPQDFSSSGLNVPAYVVSNTATAANTVQYSNFGPFAGEGSVYFPGGSGAYGRIPWSSAPLWGTGTYPTDGTIELWAYVTYINPSLSMLIAKSPGITAGTNSWTMYIDSSGRLVGGITNTTPTNFSSTSSAITLNTWNHLALTIKSGVVTVFVNGTAATSSSTFSGTIANGSSNDVLLVGNYSSGALYGYISNLRITQGLALYTSAFTPPTGPLQPVQGVTQTGAPYGTVLLLRNAPAPGRVLTQKFSGGNSANSLSFPPAAMTGYSTTLNAGYGQGTYVASASSEATAAWYAFDKTVGSGSTSYWSSAGSTYNTSTGFVSSSVVTVDVNGNPYAGEWLQIQMPSSIVLSNYSLQARGDSFIQTPINFWVLGSRDGTNWSLVDSRTAVSWTATSQIQVFSLTSSQAFSLYRLVVNRITAPSAVTSTSEWTLNGTIEGPSISPDGRLGVGVSAPVQALEVAGSAVVGGTLSAGNPLTFKNRIINGDFRVDQRGSATSVPTIGYGPDRWYMSVSSTGQSFKRYTLVAASDDVVMKQGFKYGVQINRGTGGLVDFIQWIELGNCSDMFNQPMTLSFWARSSTDAIFAMYIGISTSGTSTVTYNSGAEYRLSTNWQYITIPVNVPPVYTTSTDMSAYGIQVFLRAGTGAPNGSIQYYTGIQLEKGTVATPFEFRPYGVELALCQRYYQKSYSIATAPGTATEAGNFAFYNTIAIGIGNNLFQSGPSLQVSMRAAPTIALYTSAGAISTVWNALDGSTATTWRYLNNISGVSQSAGTVTFGWTASAEL